jgi:FMN phosphatase YigB (HAD superfamily)
MLPMLDGALENLKYLSTRYTLVLLTQGNPQVQSQKIGSLSIRVFFKKIYICDSNKGETKAQYFKQILKDFSLPAEQCLSIGNRRSTDIRFAKQLGYKTCLHIYGEHSQEAAMLVEDKADFEFSNHQELTKICQL